MVCRLGNLHHKLNHKIQLCNINKNDKKLNKYNFFSNGKEKMTFQDTKKKWMVVCSLSFFRGGFLLILYGLSLSLSL